MTLGSIVNLDFPILLCKTTPNKRHPSACDPNVNVPLTDLVSSFYQHGEYDLIG